MHAIWTYAPECQPKKPAVPEDHKSHLEIAGASLGSVYMKVSLGNAYGDSMQM